MKKKKSKERFWLTPPDIYKKLDNEFHFDFDPCPFPRPKNFDGLAVEWGKSNYVNPPFRSKHTINGSGPTAFVRKAIEENKKGKDVVLVLPVQSYVNLLLEAGAKLRSAKRIKWLEADNREPWKGPTSVAYFILKGNKK